MKQWRDLIFSDLLDGTRFDRARVDIPPDYILFIYPAPKQITTAPVQYRMYLDYRAPTHTVWERKDVELLVAATLLHEIQRDPKAFDYRLLPYKHEDQYERPRLYGPHEPA
jgi:hypothetical protein